ncbi:MAG: ATP-binding cassette domain-containing protein, partial [Candidatus Lokiarchaeota archaeon]
CKKCKGSKLREEYLSVLLQDYNIHELSEMPLDELFDVLKKVPINKTASSLVKSSYDIIMKKIEFLIDMSLGYLNLYRITASLSAGEAQRVRLASLIGSELSSLTVLLDEPSRGLHPSELEILSRKLFELRDNDNTIIMVEHDPQLIQKADIVVDLGPEAGTNGGEIIAIGTPDEIKNKNTLTGKWLSGNKRFYIKKTYRKPKKWLKIYGARENNLKGDLVQIPLECLVGICGISGSGKSSLIIDTLGRILSPKQYTTSVSYEPITPGIYEKIENKPSNTIIIDQTKTNVKSPIKFLGLKKIFEKLYAETDYARENGITLKKLKESCSACKGSGIIITDMGFLPDLKSECEICNGTGYQAEAFNIKINGVSLPEVNNLTIKEAYNLFNYEEKIEQKLNILIEVGLGYLNLNQPSHTISSGEAQRLKIAKELSKKSLKKTLFILDEPTIGLHMEDISRFMNLLQKLVTKKHTVIIIEHHPYILVSCDWLIELGPGSGPKGGNIIATGSPTDIVKIKTPTSPYLKIILEETK